MLATSPAVQYARCIVGYNTRKEPPLDPDNTMNYNHITALQIIVSVSFTEVLTTNYSDDGESWRSVTVNGRDECIAQSLTNAVATSSLSL